MIDDRDISTNPPPAAVKDAARGRVLMRARGLRKVFGGQVVLNGVAFDLHEGEVVLLRGPNGSGKTTLLNILTGNLVPDGGVIHLTVNGTLEDFTFPRCWWQNLNPFDHFLPERVAREGIGRSWQETRLFPSVSLIDNVFAAMPEQPGENPWNVLFRPHRVRAAEAAGREAAEVRLTELGLGGRDASSGDKVSLGQSKRVAIARAVQGGARILFLDEPLSGLDGTGIHSVVDLLRSLVRKHRITLVMIEHIWNVRHVAPLAHTVWDLHDGRLSIRRSPVTETVALPGEQDDLRIPDLFPDFRLARTIDLPRAARLDIYRRPGDAPATPVLQVEDLVVRRGRRLVIGENDSANGTRGLKLSIRAGDLAVLQAPNGWGKTTLLDALAGLIPAEHGSVSLCGRALTALPTWERFGQGLRYLRADSRGFPTLNVGESLRLAGRRAGEDLSLRSALSYGQLSGGQKRRVQIHALRHDRSCLFMLDEPFSALDKQTVAAAAEVIKTSFSADKRALLVALPASADAGLQT
ncbi:MAG: ATP-binding cassette domain-containing protein [bacterium]|nr:ATP-binding cassette domain-containing protein [bacterium]